MLSMMRHFLGEASGATAIEYAMILALVFLALTVGAENLSVALEGMFNYVSEEVTNSIPAG